MNDWVRILIPRFTISILRVHSRLKFFDSSFLLSAFCFSGSIIFPKVSAPRAASPYRSGPLRRTVPALEDAASSSSSTSMLDVHLPQ
jgi:hypothetical protein